MYDCVIIGGGPGGISAAIYAIRAGMKTLIVEKLGVGGQIASSDLIENYPGFPSISGGGLMKSFEEHVRGLGAQFKFAEVKKIEDSGNSRIIHTGEGDIETRTVIISTGAEPKKIGVTGEDEFIGKGISTCATCDGPFYRNKAIAVIGGGDTAVKESIYLSKIAGKIYHIHRRDRFRAEKILVDRLMSRENVEFLWKHTPLEVTGDQSGVTGLIAKNIETGGEIKLAVDGVFMFVGITPTTGFVDVRKDDQGFIITDERMRSSAPGIFAVGDCRVTPLRQVATAVGDGAIAATMAEEYISEMEGRAYPSRSVK